MKFISFGSGSSGNCYLLSSGDDALLIDVGVGIRKLKKFFADYGININTIHNILLTHDHADHIKSVGSMSGTYHIPVWATDLVHKGVTRNWMVKKKIEPILAKTIEKNNKVQIGSFEVMAFNVPHDSSDNVGYKIVADGEVFTIITDCGHITEEMGPIISDTDYLVIEANHDVEMVKNGPYPLVLQNRILGLNGHLSNKACGEALAEFASNRLKHVWLCHLSDKNNNPTMAYDTVADILSSNGINVGKDFELTVLKRTVPTE